jgi:hypothetical protein
MSLRFSTCLNHLLNTCCFLWPTNSEHAILLSSSKAIHMSSVPLLLAASSMSASPFFLDLPKLLSISSFVFLLVVFSLTTPMAFSSHLVCLPPGKSVDHSPTESISSFSLQPTWLSICCCTHATIIHRASILCLSLHLLSTERTLTSDTT